MHATTKMANLAKFRQRFGENSRMSKGARWKVTSDENGKLGKTTNLAKIRQRFGENLKVFKGASWKVVILTKMANLAKMTNSPVWSHRHVYHFGQNRHYWREPFEHIIRSSVTSSTNFAEFATFQGAPLRSHLAYRIFAMLAIFAKFGTFVKIATFNGPLWLVVGIYCLDFGGCSPNLPFSPK